MVHLLSSKFTEGGVVGYVIVVVPGHNDSGDKPTIGETLNGTDDVLVEDTPYIPILDTV